MNAPSPTYLTHPTHPEVHQMQPEFEAHNFDTNEKPRRYEAIYVIGDKMLVKVAIYQSDRAPRGAKPAWRWQASAFAWTPGQADDDYTHLCHLQRHEMTVRDVNAAEADEDTWLTAARIDADLLMQRAKVFADVIAASAPGSKGKRRVAG